MWRRKCGRDKTADRISRRLPMRATVPFDITKMDSTIPEGIDLLWNGCTINSGPLQVHLDDQARGAGDNRGELDYGTNLVHARFNVRIDLSSVAKLLASA